MFQLAQVNDRIQQIVHATHAGDTPAQVRAALGSLAGCSLVHALQQPQQAALQPQGWLAGRCCAYQDATGTLWVGIAAGGGGSAALSLDESRVSESPLPERRISQMLGLT